MKSLSLWAKEHRLAAQMLITVGHFITAYLSIQVGILLLTMGYELPNGLIFLFLELFILAIWLNPSKNDGLSKERYRMLRRFFDGAVLAIGILLTLVVANRYTSQAIDASLVERGLVNVAPSAMALNVVYEQGKTPQSQILSPKTQEKNWLQKRLIKKYEIIEQKDMSKGTKTLLLILILLGIIGVEYGLVALSCGLACNGMEALAILLLVAGLAGLVALVSLGMRRMFPNWSKKKRFGMASLMVGAPILIMLLATAISNN
ncbi:MAG: hypothetical protein JNL70_18300 [Saprospiraceae bacterium]|nr:hypothetical protein [Saprospiraceae bacterium]